MLETYAFLLSRKLESLSVERNFSRRYKGSASSSKFSIELEEQNPDIFSGGGWYRFTFELLEDWTFTWRVESRIGDDDYEDSGKYRNADKVTVNECWDDVVVPALAQYPNLWG